MAIAVSAGIPALLPWQNSHSDDYIFACLHSGCIFNSMCHCPCLLILNYCIGLLCIIKQLPHFIPEDLAFKWWIYKGSAALLSLPVQLVEGLPQGKKIVFLQRRLEKSLGFFKSCRNLFPLSFFPPKFLGFLIEN